MSLPYIFTGYAPNETRREVRLINRWLCNPRYWSQWWQGGEVAAAEDWLRAFYQVPGAFTVDSGRSALQLVLEALDLHPGDEVLVQAYTCVVVINAIRWAGAKPVFVDVTDHFTLDSIDVARKITPRTKAIIVQHTFGYAADITKILTLAQTHHLKVIEDAAQALGVRQQGRLLGTFADAAIVSFGTDKAVSAVRGGAILTSDPTLAEKLKKIVADLPAMPFAYVLPHLLHVPFFYLGKKWFAAGVGKWLLAVSQRLGLTNRIIYASEKRGEHMRPFPTKFPNVLAALVLPQLQEIEARHTERQAQASRYFAEITNPAVTLPPSAPDALFLRFPILVKNPRAWRQAAAVAHIQLGDWYDTVVAPKNILPSAAHYVPGTCPHAEELAVHSLNLPTGPNLSAAAQTRVIKFINEQK